MSLSAACSSLGLLLVIIVVLHVHYFVDSKFVDVPKKYTSSEGVKSLLCNACSRVIQDMNETLFDDTIEFESVIGFRLDSNGKKIRKESGFMELLLKMEDMCDDWKNKFKVAKRKDGRLYLLEKSENEKYENECRDQKQAIAAQQKIKYDKLYAEEVEIAAKMQNITDILVAFNDSQQGLKGADQSPSELIDDKSISEKDKVERLEKLLEMEDIKKDGRVFLEESKELEAQIEKKAYYTERKPKVFKDKSKTHKFQQPMCYYLVENLDEWMQPLQKPFLKRLAESSEDLQLKDILDFSKFCINSETFCDESMFDVSAEIWKFKKEKSIPARPPRKTVQRSEDVIQTEYEEQMEDDVDVESNNINIDDEKSEL